MCEPLDLDAIEARFTGLERFGPTAGIIRSLVAEVRSLREAELSARAEIAYAPVLTEAGRAAERAVIVRWLGPRYSFTAAADIERGAHLEDDDG